MYEAKQRKEAASRALSVNNRKHIVQYGNTRILQRYVSLLKSEFTNNFVENVSIDYALKRGGPPVKLFHESDFHEVKDGGNVYLVGHGNTEYAGSYNIDEIYNAFNNEQTGLKNNNVNIIFTSCYAGKEIAPELKRRLDEKFSKQGKYKGNIVGAKGPSIKSDETGDEIRVVNPKKSMEAARVQQDTEKIFIESDLKSNAAAYIERAIKRLESVKISEDQKQFMIEKIKKSSQNSIDGIIQDVIQYSFSIDSIEDKAGFITELTNGFFTLFIGELRKKELLVKNGVYESVLADKEKYYNEWGMLPLKGMLHV